MGGSGKISIFLQDKSRESAGDILKGNIWYRPDVENTGIFSFSVSSDFQMVQGPFRFYLKDENGNSTFSDYFSVDK